ncbi:MAG: HAMP domain-containing histidine kinase, partial [Bacteroidetes bacterium]|nr:HAMP domain-containing histidine kinase [Bacteroidota bacterium]
MGSDLYLLESFLDNYKLKDKFKDRLRKVVIHADIIRIYLQDFGKTREFSDKDLNNAFYHNLTKELTTLSYLIILLEKEIKKENNAELNTILANIINSGQEIFDTVDFIVRGTAKQSEIKILNLTRIITSTVSVLHRTFANNKVLIETNYQDVSIKGKEGDLLHVFYCVLINSIQAFRFLPHRERKIEINLFKRKHQIVISFKDNGPGIS